jgi:hypothetical protein
MIAGRQSRFETEAIKAKGSVCRIGGRTKLGMRAIIRTARVFDVGMDRTAPFPLGGKVENGKIRSRLAKESLGYGSAKRAGKPSKTGWKAFIVMTSNILTLAGASEKLRPQIT